MTPLEKDIEKSLCRMVGRHGGLCLKWVSPGRAGVPDRIILLPGRRILFVELKRPKGGNIGKLQKWWAKVIKALGFYHRFVFTHEDVKALEAVILNGIPRSDQDGYATKVCLVDEMHGGGKL